MDMEFLKHFLNYFISSGGVNSKNEAMKSR